MTIYCIDTSALIAAWQERYPIENFPPFWKYVDTLIDNGRLVAPIDVLNETEKRSDELHKWLSARKEMFRELDDDIQIAALGVLAQFPRLVGKKTPPHLCGPFRDRACSSISIADCHGREAHGKPAKAEHTGRCKCFGD